MPITFAPKPAIRQNLAARSADAEVNGLIKGTSDHQGYAAGSMVLSNLVDDGDVMMLVADGGNSKEFLRVDASIASVVLGFGMTTTTIRSAGNVLFGGVNNLFNTDGLVVDNILFKWGTSFDFASVLNTAGLSADEELTNVIEGTSVHQGTAANSLILGGITNDSDILMLVSDGGDSKEFLLVDADVAALFLGHGMATVTIKTASGQLTLSPAGYVDLASQLKLLITDTDGTVEGQLWYDASEDKLKFKTAAGVETITSA